MQIEIRQYNNELEAVWDNFIEINERNATFLHSRKFFNHNPLNKTDDSSLLFYKKNKLIGVLPAALYSKEDKIIFHSHPRSTYGGFVINSSAGVQEAMEIVESTINFAKHNQANEIIIRNPFRIFHQLPSDETDYAMWYYGFKIKSREIESAILLDDNYNKRYENGAKYNIKKAWKYVGVSLSEDVSAFWQLLTDNLAEKHNLKPIHTLEELMYLKTLVGDDKIKLISGNIDNKLVCGVLLFICKPNVLHAQYIASDANFQDIRPLNAVIDYIIKWGIENSYKFLNMGTANTDNGMKVNYGLFHFKEGFGGKGILRETMHLILN